MYFSNICQENQQIGLWNIFCDSGIFPLKFGKNIIIYSFIFWHPTCTRHPVFSYPPYLLSSPLEAMLGIAIYKLPVGFIGLLPQGTQYTFLRLFVYLKIRMLTYKLRKAFLWWLSRSFYMVPTMFEQWKCEKRGEK